MTTNTAPELHELAKDPQAFDTALAGLHGDIAVATRTLQSRMDDVYRAAGARRRSTRQGMVWDASYDAAHVKVLDTHPELVARVHEARAAWRAIENEIQAMDRAYTGWTRFFPSITKSQPHIHRSLSCSTLYPTTIMRWEPSLSGKTDDEAVAKLDESLCSVCFKDAPVRLREHVSTRTTAEQQARQAEKDERAAKLAAKQLTEAEQFRTVGHFGDRVTTVAKCKELIRKAPQALAELEWTRAHGSRVWTDPADLARVIRNREDNLAEAETDAAAAETVLLARERAHAGWGADWDMITRMRVTALKNARKEWAKN